MVLVVLCPAGTHLSGSTCAKCDKGTYNDRDGQVACTACPEDNSDSPPGSDNIDQCSTFNDVFDHHTRSFSHQKLVACEIGELK